MNKSDQMPTLPEARWLDRSTPPRVVTLVLMAGLGALSMNIFLPSLPSMAAYFGTDYGVVQLAVSAYLAVTAVLQLVLGPLSDRFGRRKVMLGSIIVFLLSTVGTIASEAVEVFLTFRMLQAASAAGIVLSRAIVRDMVPAEKAASMIGYVTMGMALVPMIGPVIGGVLDEMFGWQASFAFVGLFGVFVLAVVWFDQGETNRAQSTSMGAQIRAYPELIRSRRFWGYTAVASLASGAFFAFLGGAPWVATEVLGMDASETGLYFALIAGGYMTGNFLAGRYSERIGLNRMMLLGGMVSSAGLVGSIAFFLAGVIHPLSLFGPMFLVGAGNGLSLPNANAGMVSVRPHLAGSASGLGAALMIGGGAGLSALTGALLSPETGAYPLLLMMLGASVAATMMALYVMRVARRAAAEAATIYKGAA